MRTRIRRPGRVAAVAAGLLCAAAATVAVWSGPLKSATAGFHGTTVTHVTRAASHFPR